MEYVGLGSLFTSILQVLSLAEMGFGSAIIYGMYRPIAEHDTVLICALLNLYRKIYRIVGAIILCMGLLILPFLNKFVSGEVPADINLYSLFLIYLFNTVISYFTFAYKQALLFSHQRTDIENNISSFANIGMYICQIIALIFTHNYYIYIIFLPICTILINIIRSIYVDKMFPDYRCQGKIRNDLKRDLYKRVYGLLITRICQVCRNSFDSLVISAFLGLEILGKYQNYYYVINTVIGFLAIITSSIVGGIGNNIVTKSVDENYRQFNIFMFGYNWICSWCTVCFLCLYQSFMRIWVGTQNMFSMILVVLMCIYFYSLKVGDIVALYKEATGIYWEDRKRPVVESAVNLVLNIAFVRFLGVYGVVLSTIISIIFINIPWAAYILFKIYFKKSVKVYFIKIFHNLIILIIVGSITYILCDFIKFPPIQELIFKMLICIFFPNILFIIFNLKDRNMFAFMGYIKKVFKKNI